MCVSCGWRMGLVFTTSFTTELRRDKERNEMDQALLALGRTSGRQKRQKLQLWGFLVLLDLIMLSLHFTSQMFGRNLFEVWSNEPGNWCLWLVRPLGIMLQEKIVKADVIIYNTAISAAEKISNWQVLQQRGGWAWFVLQVTLPWGPDKKILPRETPGVSLICHSSIQFSGYLLLGCTGNDRFLSSSHGYGSKAEWLGTFHVFSNVLGISSSQLTNKGQWRAGFFRGVATQQTQAPAGWTSTQMERC